MTLEALLALCHTHGVHTIKATTEDAGAVDMMLDLRMKPAEPVFEVPKHSEPTEAPKRGKDGKTAEEQEELYGAPMSDTVG